MEKSEKINILPKKLAQALARQDIAVENILVFAQADMNTECEFVRSFFILTSNQLIQGRSPHINTQRALSGFTGEAAVDYSDFVVTVTPIEDISDAKTENLVVGGIFIYKLNGVETAAAAFTNNYSARMHKLCELIGKVKENAEITDDMLTQEIREDVCPKCGKAYPDKERKVCPKCMDKRSIFFRLFEHFKPYRVHLAVICVMCIFNALLNAVWPYLNGSILFDRVLARDMEFVGQYLPNIKDIMLILLILTLIMAGAKLMQQLFGIIHGRLVAKIVPQVVCNLKNRVFKAIQELSISFFSGRQTGGLMTRVIDDAQRVSDIFIDGLPYILPNLMTVVFSCVVMFSSNWQLAIVAVIVLPLILIVSVRLEPILWHFYSKQHQTWRNMRAQLNDNITGSRVVKAFGQEQQEVARFKKVNSKVLDAQMDVVGFDTKFIALYRFCEIITSLMVWGFGAMFVLNFFDMKMTYGTLVTFVGYVTLLTGPVDFFSYIFRWWSSSMNSAQRIFEIIDAKPEVVQTHNPIKPESLNGDILLEDVTFEYEANKEVLKNINLHIKAGRMLGIVGKSGAGKSTLVNLITRLYDTKSGNIYIDGVNIRDMLFEDVRSAVAMVSQETYIFRGTIFDNIAYAKPESSRQEVISAAVAACAHDFICKLPDGYDTFVGSGGRSLSGGERQRVSIARAILANPKILILDEATAAVDTETEKNIQDSLERLIAGRTTISIAHRISTLRNADELIVIENGKITEQGTHDELIHKKGDYFKLLQIQSKALAMRGVAQ